MKAEGTFLSGPGPLRENCHLPKLGGQQLVSSEHESMEPLAPVGGQKFPDGSIAVCVYCS